ncbi:MAG TPA: transcriptional regulator, partial [Sphingobium sp.]|nr:transcriptional regulator [Sphingobium sp.]
AISLSSAAQYMDDARMDMLTENVRATAQKVSADLGWTPGVKSPRRPVRR